MSDMVSKPAPKLTNQTKIVKLKDLKEYKNNIVVHSEKQIDDLAESIRKYGYTQLIGVDKNNVIIFGHARRLALKKLYDDNAEIEVRDLSNLAPKLVKEIRIVDNTVSSDEYDPDKVLASLGDLYSEIDKNVVMDDLHLNMDDFEDVFKDETEKKTRSASNKICQIILGFDKDEYDEFNDLCDALMQRTGIESKSEVLLALLNKESESKLFEGFFKDE